MPELPEAEAARRVLERALVGRRIGGAALHAPALLRGPAAAAADPARAFAGALVGRRVVEATRLGKHLRAALDDGGVWWLHLGMSGRLRPRGATPEAAPIRLVVEAEGGGGVALEDRRKLGRTAAGPPAEVDAIAGLAALGPDALALAAAPEAFADRLAGAGRRPVKAALLDQGVVAGVGNIQATEALWAARLHPATPARAVPRPAAVALARALHDGFLRTLDALEASDLRYVQDGGAHGFVVYGRAGAPCPRCRATLETVRLGGRSNVTCPACQRA